MRNLDVRICVTLPSGKREEFGYSWPEHRIDGSTFAPLPRDREIDHFSMVEAGAQRDRRNRIAEAIGRELADIILTAAEKNDTRNGYPAAKP